MAVYFMFMLCSSLVIRNVLHWIWKREIRPKGEWKISGLIISPLNLMVVCTWSYNIIKEGRIFRIVIQLTRWKKNQTKQKRKNACPCPPKQDLNNCVPGFIGNMCQFILTFLPYCRHISPYIAMFCRISKYFAGNSFQLLQILSDGRNTAVTAALTLLCAPSGHLIVSHEQRCLHH